MGMRVEEAIGRLVAYGIEKGLIEREDAVYTVNRLLEILHIEEYKEPEENYENVELLPALETLVDYAVEKGLTLNDGVTARDLFDTRIMGLFADRPSGVTAKFKRLYAESPEKATDWFYRFCIDVNYIRADRIRKDLKWKTATKYGELDVTVNLSKPEKDPKAIAAAKNAPQSAYPKCQLCRENVGYAGRLSHPARQNLRAIPLTLGGEDWMLQYSPYVYYNEHCLVFNCRHTPMKISRGTFVRLLDFVGQFRHYFLGSNADLPIVGGSILSHDHFQGGRYVFPMEKAEIELPFEFPGFEDIEAGVVRWPMSCLRLRSADRERLTDLSEKILESWRAYSDHSCSVCAESNGEKHNTVTPIARFRDGKFEMDLVLRCNVTSNEHPLGVFHPHADKHHIKKENIGLIEVMGLAVLPARLKNELKQLEEYLIGRELPSGSETLEKHAPWCAELLEKYKAINKDNVEEILKREVGLVFAGVLEDAGVYKCTKEGREGFLRFLKQVK